MYKLFTDKNEFFECNINLTGASYNKTSARLVIETTDFSLMFNGTVGSKGECKVPIKKLKGLIGETSKGNIRLEVIADDTYFIPWKSEFEINASKKVTVEIKSQQKPMLESRGPRVKVSKIKETKKINKSKQVTITESEKSHIFNIMKLLIHEN